MCLPNQDTAPDDIWSALEEPSRPAKMDSRYRLLLAALDTGWQVEPPVYLRPRFSDDGPRVYHFILRRSTPRSTRLLSVPECSEVRRFVMSEGLSVISSGQGVP